MVLFREYERNSGKFTFVEPHFLTHLRCISYCGQFPNCIAEAMKAVGYQDAEDM